MAMWTTIVGAFFMLSGVIFVIKPERLRKRFQKKTGPAVRKTLFAAACFFGALLISAGWKHEGTLPKVLTIAGVLIFIKGLYVLKAKSADAITAWIVKVHPLYFRIFALLQILTGLVIILGLEIVTLPW